MASAFDSKKLTPRVTCHAMSSAVPPGANRVAGVMFADDAGFQEKSSRLFLDHPAPKPMKGATPESRMGNSAYPVSIKLLDDTFPLKSDGSGASSKWSRR